MSRPCAELASRAGTGQTGGAPLQPSNDARSCPAKADRQEWAAHSGVPVRRHGRMSPDAAHVRAASPRCWTKMASAHARATRLRPRRTALDPVGRRDHQVMWRMAQTSLSGTSARAWQASLVGRARIVTPRGGRVPRAGQNRDGSPRVDWLTLNAPLPPAGLSPSAPSARPTLSCPGSRALPRSAFADNFTEGLRTRGRPCDRSPRVRLNTAGSPAAADTFREDIVIARRERLRTGRGRGASSCRPRSPAKRELRPVWPAM